jgi:hypothetical protein
MPHLLYGGRQRLGGENYPDTDASIFAAFSKSKITQFSMRQHNLPLAR